MNEPIAELTELFKTQRFCVLATHDGDYPYANLVAFAATPDLKEILFATARNTRKFRILSTDGRVALLIDNRTNQDSDRQAAMAVTVTGVAREIGAEQLKVNSEILIDKHSNMKDFISSSSSALFRVVVQKLTVVTGFDKVVEIRIGDAGLELAHPSSNR